MAGAQGYWRLGALPRRSPCRVRYNTFTAWFHNDAGSCCFSLFLQYVLQVWFALVGQLLAAARIVKL